MCCDTFVFCVNFFVGHMGIWCNRGIYVICHSIRKKNLSLYVDIHLSTKLTFFFIYIFVIVILFSSLVAHSCCNPLILTVVSCCSHNYSYLWLFMILLLIIIALVVIKFKSHFISYGDDTYFVIIFIVLLYI